MVFKILVVEEEELEVQHKLVLVVAVPVSFSSHILHKYSKNTKWA
jgi:hypothetical protein